MSFNVNLKSGLIQHTIDFPEYVRIDKVHCSAPHPTLPNHWFRPPWSQHTCTYLGDMLTSKIHGFRVSSRRTSNPNNSWTQYLLRQLDLIMLLMGDSALKERPIKQIKVGCFNDSVVTHRNQSFYSEVRKTYKSVILLRSQKNIQVSHFTL